MCRPGASSTRAAGCPRIRVFSLCGSFLPTPSLRCAEPEPWPEDEDEMVRMMNMIDGVIPTETDGVSSCSPGPRVDEDDCSPAHQPTRRISRSRSDSRCAPDGILVDNDHKSSRHVGEPGPTDDDGPFINTTFKCSAPIDTIACSPHLRVHSNLESILGNETSRPHHIPLQDLKEITGNFSDAWILGQGGFGVVYKGVLPNGEMIAVKKIVATLMPGLQKQFESEVYHLMMLKHPNIVRCLGYCYETHNVCLEYNGKYVFAEMAERLICLEYMPKGSLDMHLSDESSGLGWSTRYNIIEGICYGLCHLHEQMIIHLDLKPANILLDDSMSPKISDFGMSRLLDQQQTIFTSSLDGTLGYMAPEYLHGGTITRKSDIFSLGVIIMEILTGHRDYPAVGRAPFDEFIELTLEKWRNALQRSPRYKSIQTGYEQIKRCIEVGLTCVNPDRKKRPPIKKVISMLQGLESIDSDISNEATT